MEEVLEKMMQKKSPYLGSKAAALINEDEIFEDPQFMEKDLEFIGKKFRGIKYWELLATTSTLMMISYSKKKFFP